MGDPLARFLQPAAPQKPANDPLADFLTREEPANTGAPSFGGYGKLSAIGEGMIETGKQAVKNVVGIADLVAHHPVDALGQGLAAGGEAIGQMFSDPVATGRSFIWDGMIKPILVNPVEIAFSPNMTHDEIVKKSAEATVAYAGFALGYGVGHALAAGGKLAESAGALRALGRVKSLEQAAQVAADATGNVGAVTATAVANRANIPRLIAGWTVGGFAQGATMGIFGNVDPQTALNQSIASGFMGSVLGVGFGALHAGGVKLLSKRQQKITAASFEEQKKMLVKYGGIHAAIDLAQGIDFVNTMAKWLPQGQTHVFENLPEGSFNRQTLPESAHVVKNKNGTYRVLLQGEGIGQATTPESVYPIEVNPPQSQGAEKIASLPDDALIAPLTNDINSDVNGLTQIGPQAGSNIGGLYQTQHGGKFYIKFHENADQTAVEAVSNALYRMIGLNAPEPWLVYQLNEPHKPYIANKYLEGAQQLAETGLNHDIANKILDGFAMDVLLSNRDVLGTGVTSFDNIVITPDGELHRIDQGGTLWYRGMQGKKPATDWVQLKEWEGFANPSLNPRYVEVLNMAGYSHPNELGMRVVEQIDNITRMKQKYGGWNKIVGEMLGSQFESSIINTIASVLEQRHNALIEKRNEVLSDPKAYEYANQQHINALAEAMEGGEAAMKQASYWQKQLMSLDAFKQSAKNQGVIRIGTDGYLDAQSGTKINGGFKNFVMKNLVKYGVPKADELSAYGELSNISDAQEFFNKLNNWGVDANTPVQDYGYKGYTFKVDGEPHIFDFDKGNYVSVAQAKAEKNLAPAASPGTIGLKSGKSYLISYHGEPISPSFKEFVLKNLTKYVKNENIGTAYKELMDATDAGDFVHTLNYFGDVPDTTPYYKALDDAGYNGSAWKDVNEVMLYDKSLDIDLPLKDLMKLQEDAELPPPVEKLGPLPPSAIDFWKQTGFFPNHVVSYKGQEFSLVERTSKGKAKIKSMVDGKEKTVPFGQLTSSPQVEISKVIQPYKHEGQTPATVAGAWAATKAWLKDSYDKILSGKEPNTTTMPKIGVVRGQSFKDLAFSPLKSGTWFSFTGPNGKHANGYIHQDGMLAEDHAVKTSIPKEQFNWTRAANYAGHEGGKYAKYALLELQKPLLLLEGDSSGGNTGYAVVSKFKPEWIHDYSKKKAWAYLKTKIKSPEELQVYENTEGSYVWWDRIGSELARDLGYKEILNVTSVNNFHGGSSELVLLYDAKDAKFQKLGEKEQYPIQFRFYDPSDFAEFKQAIENSPEDAAIWEKNQQQLDAIESMKIDEAIGRVGDHGYYFKEYGTNAIGLYDKTGRLVQIADDLKDALKLSEQVPDITPLILAPEVPGAPPPTALGEFLKPDEPPTPSRYGFFEWLRDEANLRVSAMATPYSFFSTASTRFGKDFFNKLFLPLQKAKLRYIGELKPWAEKLNAQLAPMKKWTAEQRTHLFNAIQTFSAAEMKSGKPTVLSRALNADEIRLGEGLASSTTKADRQFAYEVSRLQDQLADELAKGKRKPAEVNAIMAERIKSATPNQLQAFKTFTDIKSVPKTDVDLYGVSRLADAIELGDLSRADYVSKYGVDTKMIAIVESLYNQLGTLFGIDKASRLGGYITHILQKDYSVKDGSLIANSKYISAATREFLYALPRTGEHQLLLTDPAEILARYLKHGMKAKHLYPEVKEVRDWLMKSYEGMQPQAAELMRRRAEDYIGEIQGFKNPEDALVLDGEVEYTKGAMYKMFERVGIPQALSKDWLGTYLKVSEISTQGFKPIAGVRDATSFLIHYYTRFGAARTRRMMAMANEALKSKEALEANGKIPTLNVQFYNTLDQVANFSKLDKVAELGFKLSGQPVVFEMSHAMTFLETKANTANALTDWVSQKITRKQMEKKLDLESYEKPVIDEFNRLVGNGKFGDAIDYLSDITGREVVGYYGIANHPFFMQSRLGKVLGQHGQWPLWMAQNFMRMAARGSVGSRLGKWMKVAAITGAMAYVADKTDLNLSSWYLDPTNSIFAGGPLAQAGMFGLMALSNYEPVAQFGQSQLMRYTDLSKPQFYLPIPSQAYNIVEAWNRMGQSDPLHIVGARLLGIRVDSEDYPRP